MIIELKQKHINQGERESPCNCALARAFKEALGIPADAVDRSYPNRVEVCHESVEVYRNDELVYDFKTPRKAAKLIDKFDDLGKKYVKPGMFEFIPKQEDE